MDPSSTIATAAVASLLAGAATGAGALPVFLVRSVRPSTEAGMLGFSAGVMLAASCFSLAIPGIEAAMRKGHGTAEASLIVAIGILVGAALLLLANRALPHEHFFKGREGISTERMGRIWLFVFAVALHNLPEGLAMGVGFGGSDGSHGKSIAIGMGLQNVPEGLAVALALRDIDYGAFRAFVVALLTGLLEPVAAIVGITAVTASEALLPWGMGFAAGAMLFVISHEIVPESHRRGHALPATTGLLVGFVVMMVLDTAFA